MALLIPLMKMQITATTINAIYLYINVQSIFVSECKEEIRTQCTVITHIPTFAWSFARNLISMFAISNKLIALQQSWLCEMKCGCILSDYTLYIHALECNNDIFCWQPGQLEMKRTLMQQVIDGKAITMISQISYDIITLLQIDANWLLLLDA